MTDVCEWSETFIKYTGANIEVADEWRNAFPETISGETALLYIVDPHANPISVSQIITNYIGETIPIPSFHQQLMYYTNSVNERKQSELNNKLVYSGGIGFVLGVVTLSVIQLVKK